MNKNSGPPAVRSEELAPYLEDLYELVSRKIGCTQSFVASVALGQSKSQIVESALERELRDILERVKKNHTNKRLEPGSPLNTLTGVPNE